MELVILKEKEFLDFVLKHDQISIYQLPVWGDLKKKNGWEKFLVGFKDKKNIVAATMLLSKSTPIRKNIFYAPRGFLIDYKNFELLQNFVNAIRIFVQEHKGFMLKIDPNVIYQIRDIDGNEINEKHNNIVSNLINNGFKHLGFTSDIDGMQPRFLCRFKLSADYEKTLATFTKSTRKNIEDSYAKGVEVRNATDKDIKTFVSLLDETAERKKFALRPMSYYKDMFNLLSDYSKIYISSINTSKYLEIVNKKIEKEKINHEEIVNKMRTETVGKKLKFELESSNKRSLKLIEERRYAEKLNKLSDKIDIGTLYALYIGNEGITFMSGINNEYRKFNPKYAMYDTHIKECLNQQLEYVNFYGISGNFNPQSSLYGIYELKKGFNTEVIELVGEFDLIINKLDYILYKIAFSVYTGLKRIK